MRLHVDLGKNNVHIENKQWLVFHSYMLSIVLNINYKIIELEELCSEYYNVDTFRKSLWDGAPITRSWSWS